MSNPANKKSISDTHFSFPIANLDTDQYPDNPDIGFWDDNYKEVYFKDGQIIKHSGFKHSMCFYTKSGDSIVFDELDLSELIPTIPNAIKDQEYLSFLACINQEWNRNQIRFTSNFFSTCC